MNTSIALNWKVGYTKALEATPDSWKPAQVPGAVQLDLMPDEIRGNWQFGNRFEQLGWMEDVYWTYQTTFKGPELQQGEKLYFISKGIDYCFDIQLNGDLLHRQKGMFTPVKANLTHMLKEDNTLEVKIYPVPKSCQAPNTRAQANACVKPAVSYGWDWHPRLIPSGIWDETCLSVERPGIVEAQIRYNLDLQQRTADIRIRTELAADLGEVGLEIFSADEVVYECSYPIDCNTPHSRTLIVQLDNIKLWYPRGYGNQHLYRFSLTAKNKQGRELSRTILNTGFRQVKLVMNQGTEKEENRFPKPKRLAPITLEVNGQRIFALGTNWVNPEVFPGTLTNERYQELIDRAVEANFNILRVWGGGIVNKEFFYEYCDRAGMMVWQEFPLSANNYPDQAEYLEILEQEATSIINRLKIHPSLCLWCGGNELFNSWSGMTEQSLAPRLLNAICLRHTPEIPFLPTAPIDGMAHGHYIFYDWENQRDVFETMQMANNTAYTEFGMPGPTSVDELKKIIPEDELFPPRKHSAAWLAHHGFGSWLDDTWLCLPTQEKYFGKAENLEELVDNGQRLQAIGYQAIYETARQQWPYCSMALNWCFNEPWITAANNSIVQYNGLPKPAFYAIKQACRPIIASAAFARFSWQRGEMLSFNTFILNNSTAKTGADTLQILINQKVVTEWPFDDSPANQKLTGPAINWLIPANAEKEIKIELRLKNQSAMDSAYVVFVEAEKAAGPEKDRLNF